MPSRVRRAVVTITAITAFVAVQAPPAFSFDCEDDVHSLTATPQTQVLGVGDEATILVKSFNCVREEITGKSVSVTVNGVNLFRNSGQTPFQFAYRGATVGRDELTFTHVGVRTFPGTPFPSGVSRTVSATIDWEDRGVSEESLYDERLAVVSARYPSFVGASVDEDAGTLNVIVTDPTVALAPIQETLSAVLDNPDLRTYTPTRGLAEFPFQKLYPWHSQLSPMALGLPTVLSTDIHEAIGKIRIGAEDVTLAAQQLTAVLAEVGIPPDAVVFEQESPTKYSIGSSLRDFHRPVVGGLRIGYGGTATQFKVCTLGFVATKVSSNNTPGIVTNAHCSGTFGALDSTTFGQPNNSPTFAYETMDPPLFTGGSCPANRRCRYSDALFAAISSPVSGTTHLQGRVAKTALGSYSWDGSRFTINAKQNPVYDQRVHMVGMISGRQSGRVQATCSNMKQFNEGRDTGRTMLCQMVASYFNNDGDSGAPMISHTTTDTRSLLGINWTGNGSSTGIFSPWSNITRSSELGSLKACAPELYTC